MGIIKILDKDLISKIAAGEVIERPASVVKELIENSIDAGANSITIDIIEGGKTLIRVTDNGCGMVEEDAILAYDRHTTSKLSSQEDLFKIQSLGFRGEALSSIAAISKLTIKTRTSKSFVGTKVVVEPTETKISEIGYPKGTTIEVENLFFNTPARKKYLKSIESEIRQIIEIVTRYSLGYPNIFFKLTSDSKQVLIAPATTNTLSNIANIYGRNVAKKLLQVNFSTQNIEVMGFVSNPDFSKPNKNFQTIFVNNRYVSNKIISNAVNEAYHNLLPINRYSLFVIHVTLDPSKLDVNVHPSKKTIKFSDETQVYDAVFNALRRTLRDNEHIPQIEEKPTQQAVLITKKIIQKKDPTHYPVPKPMQTLLKETSDTVETKTLPNLRIIGQLNKTFILAEGSDGLYLIDQHVAEERVNYEKYQKEISAKHITTQVLLDPIILELEPKQYTLVISNLEFLSSLGINVEEFGKNTIVIRSMPVIFSSADKQFMLDIIDELQRANNKIDEEKERLVTLKACKSSIKANQELTLPQINKIINDLAQTQYPYTCPHGRPVIIKLTKEEIEKRFKRR